MSTRIEVDSNGDLIVEVAGHRLWLHGPAASHPEAIVAALRLMTDLCRLPDGWAVVVEPVKEG